MKLRCSLENVDMGEEIISVPVGDEAEKVHGVLKLNEEGQEIIDFLKEDTTEERIVDSLAERYENDRAQLAKYVHNVVDNLRRAGLITE